LGIALNVPEGGGEAELLDTLRENIRLGLDGAAVSVKWSDVERSPGQYEWKALDDGLGFAKMMGAEVALTIQTIDTNQRTMPSDLMGKPFNDPELRRRWREFLAAMVPRLTPAVKWVSLGNEVDGYLGTRPDELGPFAEFMREGRNVLRQAKAGLPVGVTLMAHELDRNPTVAGQLIPVCDVVFFTLYPIGPDFRPMPPAEWPKSLRKALAAAGTRPVIIQELGLPSSPVVDSSPKLQADFVRAMMHELERGGDQIRLVSFFMSVDFGRAFLDVLSKYYGLDDARFREFLGSLGFKDAQGKARPAWWEFVRAARAWDARKRPEPAVP